MTQETPEIKYRKDYMAPDFRVEQATLFVDIREDHTLIRSTLSMHRNADRPGGQPLVLDGREMELENVSLDGSPLDSSRYRVDGQHLSVFDVPDTFDITTTVRLDPDNNTALEGFYRSGDILCTQCEPHGFSRITYYPDRPDVMAPMTATLEADRERYPVLLCNGNPVEQGTSKNESRHWVRWEDPYSKPCYLFAMVAGDLARIEDRYTTAEGRAVALKLYVDHGNEDQAGHAMEALKSAMAWDERRYGLSYDLDVYMIVAVDAFNMGAMENKGLNLFNSSCVLASPETATDRNFERVWTVVAHEYFHNWTGNRVTCRDWFQLSLKESLTVFREEQFSAETGSSAIQRIDKVRMLRAMQFPEDSGPMAHPVRPESYREVNNFYTLTVYEKGAEVIGMMHTLLGDEPFVNGVRRYLERHDGEAATIEDFVRALEEASGRDLEQFRLWYSQAGTPELTVTDHYDADRGQYDLTLRVDLPKTPGQPEKRPMHIPLALGLLDDSGKEIPLSTSSGESEPESGLLGLREPEQSFHFQNVATRPVPSLLRDFTAPVKLHYDYSNSQLRMLMVHDIDAFSRWEAAQRLAVRAMLRSAGQDALDHLLDGWQHLLEQPADDAALLAEIITLPDEQYLGEQMRVIDVDAIARTRTAIRKRITDTLGQALLRTFEANAAPDKPFRHTPGEAARRRLCGACLGYLTSRDTEEDRQRALAHYRAAGNMTDAAYALASLNDVASPERDRAFAEFEQRWLDTPLVLDKWFAWQATARREDAPEQVSALMQHKRFNLDNPNRVRALPGAFAVQNLTGFHRTDGTGYKLLGDTVLTLDERNPQIAARLASAFSRWRRFDERRQDLMKEQLQRFSSQHKLSGNVREIVEKSL